jgi:GNAT superfamily N-acetyltransferase
MQTYTPGFAASLYPRADLDCGNLGGRLQEAEALIASSWSENKDQTLQYNAEFLSSCYEYPGTDERLSPTLFRDGRLIAFVSAFPRHVRFQGENLRLALLTIFTVSPEHKGMGLGKAIWRECLSRVRQAGYDGALHYCVDGNKSNHVTVAAAKSMGLESARVFTVNYLIAALPKLESQNSAEPTGEFLQSFVSMAEAVGDRVPFSRVWSTDEVEWHCAKRYGSVRAMYRHGGKTGLLNGYTVGIASQSGTSSLFVEDVFWGDLEGEQRTALLNSFLGAACSSAQVAVVPLWGYFDPAPFAKARFRLSTRKLHAYLTLWDDRPTPACMDSLYIDVF